MYDHFRAEKLPRDVTKERSIKQVFEVHQPHTVVKMQASDMQVIKDIPGYKVILKAVLKSQIQQLVGVNNIGLDTEI